MPVSNQRLSSSEMKFTLREKSWRVNTDETVLCGCIFQIKLIYYQTHYRCGPRCKDLLSLLITQSISINTLYNCLLPNRFPLPQTFRMVGLLEKLFIFSSYCTSSKTVAQLRGLQRRHTHTHTEHTGISIALSGSYWHLVYPADWVNSLTNDSHLLSQTHHLACGLYVCVCEWMFVRERKH